MPGSTHGYDGIDPARINPELGGEAGFRQLAEVTRAHGMGLILDIVPNHLAASPHSPWWSDVLMHGPRSPHAAWFDIDWEAPGCEGRLWLPVLDRPLHDAVRDGVVRVVVDNARPVLRHHGLALPLSPRSHPLEPAQWLAWAERCNRSVERLHTLLQRQHYRLAWWRTAGDQVNYRRFSISTNWPRCGWSARMCSTQCMRCRCGWYARDGWTACASTTWMACPPGRVPAAPASIARRRLRGRRS